MATSKIFWLLSWGFFITVHMANFNYGRRHLVTDTFSRRKETVLLQKVLQLVKNQERKITSINDKLSQCLSISGTFPYGSHDDESTPSLLHSNSVMQGTTTFTILQERKSTILEPNPTLKTTDEEPQTNEILTSTARKAKSMGGDLTFFPAISTSSLASTTAATPSTTQAARPMGSRGREFFILFMRNFPSAIGNLSVHITTNNETTVKVLTSPSLDTDFKSVIHFNSNFKLGPPLNLVCEYSTVEQKGLILQTSELSTVTIFDSYYTYSNDGALIIPIQKLSNKYIVSSTEPYTTSRNYYSQFAIGALYNRTNVEIIFKLKHNTPLTMQGKSYRDGDIFVVTLERFDTLQIGHVTDLSGSFITSTKPIAVFSGNRCVNLKSLGCSHMVTQLPPTTEIDTRYIIPPFYNNAGTLIQVLSENRSSINSSVGSSVSNFHLNEKGYKNIDVTSNVTTVIESNQPVLVTAFGMGRPHGPYMTVVPGIHQYLDYYKVFVPAGYEENFLCVIVPSQSLYNLRINGLSVLHYISVYQSAWTLTKQFSIRTFKVQSGTFVLSTTDASQFGLIVYGHRFSDGYGFAGNCVHP